MFQPSAGNRIVTFGNLFVFYLENHAKPHCKRWRDMERTFASYLTHWKELPADSLKKIDVQQLHTTLGQSVGPTTANRVVQLIRSIYNRSIEWELVMRNPALGVRLFKLKSRDRFLEVEEIARFALAVDTLRYKTTRDFLWLCLLTAARRSNVAAMRWEDLSLDRAVWYMPDTKNGTAHYIPLVAPAVEILKERKENAKSEWVFPSTRSRSGHLTKPELAWKMVILRAGLSNARIHDLRRTLASWQAMTGANMFVIMQTLNHKSVKSAQVYARLQLEPVRNSMEEALRAMKIQYRPKG